MLDTQSLIWNTIKIFISSTFRDMHKERDHLVRFVFPELKERCRKLHIHLVDVDLRWGVSEKDSEAGKALDICLDEIDTCRPYFIGLLGHRYGFIPPGHQHSITAQEIYHGVLHNDLPKQVIDLRKIIEGKLEGIMPTREQIDILTSSYLWNEEKRKYLLAEKVTSEVEAVIRSVFRQYSAYQKDHSFYFFRSGSLTRELAGSNIEDYMDAAPEDRRRLSQLKQDIIDSGLPYFKYSTIEEFGNTVLETLWERIRREEYGQHAAKDWLEREAELHSLFMADRTRKFVGRRQLLDQLHSFCNESLHTGSVPNAMIVTGEPGSGKSALMARFAEDMLHRRPDLLLITHFIGASPDSASLNKMLKRFCLSLNKELGLKEAVPEETQELIKIFRDRISEMTKHKKIILVIDALNQLEKSDHALKLHWLPRTLPRGMSIITSTLPGDVYYALTNRLAESVTVIMKGLEPAEVKTLVQEYLGEMRKEFPNLKAAQAFLNKLAPGNPLYISVALEELRIFPYFEKVSERIDSFPDSIPALFDQVLERIEADFDPSMVKDMMSYIACGRHGMTSEELQALLRSYAPGGPSSPRLPDMLWARLYRAFRPYLFERSGIIDFYHEQVREAVLKRYINTETHRKSCHGVIADYFESRWNEPYLRALDELPYHRTKYADPDGLERLLTDLSFIEEKCAAGMIYSLVEDYTLAFGVFPQEQEKKQKERGYGEVAVAYARAMTAYARSRGNIPLPEAPDSLHPLTEGEIRAEANSPDELNYKFQRISAFSRFVNAEAHNLADFGFIRGFCKQQACNFAADGPVAAAGRAAVYSDLTSPFLLKEEFILPPDDPHPACLRILKGHTSSVTSVSITADGRWAISGSLDSSLRLWDIETGECLQVFEAHGDAIDRVRLTPDGKRAVSLEWKKNLRVWDISANSCIFSLEGVSAFDLVPDGKYALVGLEDKTLHFLDIETGALLQTITSLEGWPTFILITPDGKRAITRHWSLSNYYSDPVIRDLETGARLMSLPVAASYNITPDGKQLLYGASSDIVIWDLVKGGNLRRLPVKADPGSVLAVTPDGKLALSAGNDNSDSSGLRHNRILRVWDLETGTCLREFEGHSETIKEVSVTPEGRLAVSASSDGTLLVWDITRGLCKPVQRNHSKAVRAVDITPDGKLAVSGSDDNTIRLWDTGTGKCLRTSKTQLSPSYSVVITPDGKNMVKTVFSPSVYDLETGALLQYIPNSLTRGSFNIGFSPDGRQGVTDGINSDDHFIACIWDFGAKACSRFYETSTFYAVGITPDCKLVFIGNEDGTIYLRDMITDVCLRTLKGHISSVKVLCPTHDGRYLVSGSADGDIRVWSVKSGECIRTIKDHSRTVEALSITPDGKHIISAGFDKTLRIWEMETGECLAVTFLPGWINSLATGPDNRYSAGDNLGNICFFNGRNIKQGTPHVTAVRLWRLSLDNKDGAWDEELTAGCGWCGCRFAAPPSILDAIKAFCISSDDKSRQKPELLSECPHCHMPLRYNPFLVDRRELLPALPVKNAKVKQRGFFKGLFSK